MLAPHRAQHSVVRCSDVRTTRKRARAREKRKREYGCALKSGSVWMCVVGVGSGARDVSDRVRSRYEQPSSFVGRRCARQMSFVGGGASVAVGWY